jgi:short-subunit dehydrogenase
MTASEHVLVTGAGGAIGAALVRAMRAAWPGTRFALLDRELASMQQLARDVGNASLHAVDLTDLDALPGVVAAIEQTQPLDGLVNCAGVMVVRRIESWRWQDARHSLDVNLLAPLRLQDLVVPGMVARRRGLIVNVSSMAGRVPLKGCTYYGASKAGLGMASEIARAELARHDVRVITVYPGPVKSQLEQAARDGYGGGGSVGRIAPVGDPAVLATKIMMAIERDEPRVIYPRLYGIGWTAPNTAARLMLKLGPLPVENA